MLLIIFFVMVILSCFSLNTLDYAVKTSNPKISVAWNNNFISFSYYLFNFRQPDGFAHCSYWDPAYRGFRSIWVSIITIEEKREYGKECATQIFSWKGYVISSQILANICHMGTDNFTRCGKYNILCAQEEKQKHMDEDINDITRRIDTS